MSKILAEVNRRNLFRYLGNAAVCAPFMRTLFETEVFGANTAKRAIFFYFPSGIVSQYWHPKTLGTNFDLPLSIAPLASVKSDIVVLNGVDYKCGHSHNEGTRYSLTGGSGGPSLDTILGDRLKGNVRLPILRVGNLSQLRTGYDLAVSWNQQGQPAPVDDNPRKAFQTVFGNAGLGLVDNDPYKGDRSVLDFAIEDIKSLQNRLGSIEKEKLDFHLSSLRELERRIDLISNPTPEMPDMGGGGGGPAMCTKEVDFQGLNIPDNNPESVYYDPNNFNKVTGIMIDIAVQALACGVTNVAMLQIMHAIDDVFQMSFPGGPNFPIAQHTSSHHDLNPEKMLQFSKIQAYYMQAYALLISKLKAVKEGDSNVLYNSIALAFSEIGDPGFHQMDNVGLILAGQAGGKIKTGQAIDAKGRTQPDVLKTIGQAVGAEPDTGGLIPGLFR